MRINNYLRAIDAIDKEIMQADRDVYSRVVSLDSAKLLKSIPDVGEYTAMVVLSEVGDAERFSTPNKLYPYTGIVPSVRNSADKVVHKSITHRGSGILRWILTEAIHTHVRYCEDSNLTIFYNRLSMKRGSALKQM